MRTIRRALYAAAATFVLAGTARAIDVTTCGQIVQGTGDLVGDLDCSGHAGRSVQVIGRLRLNGFTLTGNPAHTVVLCNIGSCSVQGPGTIRGGSTGVSSGVGATIADATIELNTNLGVRAFRAVRVTGASVIASNGGDGIQADQVALLGGKGALPDPVVSGNGGTGVRAALTARIQDATVTGNTGSGVVAGRQATVTRGVVQGNGLDGVRGKRVRLRDATATGNRTDPACGVTEECADVASDLKPAVVGASTCEVSRNPASGGDWDVCTLD